MSLKQGFLIRLKHWNRSGFLNHYGWIYCFFTAILSWFDTVDWGYKCGCFIIQLNDVASYFGAIVWRNGFKEKERINTVWDSLCYRWTKHWLDQVTGYRGRPYLPLLIADFFQSGPLERLMWNWLRSFSIAVVFMPVHNPPWIYQGRNTHHEIEAFIQGICPKCSDSAEWFSVSTGLPLPKEFIEW